MNPTWRVLGVLACLLGAACSEPVYPDHAPAYPFTDPAGAIFRWPAARLPVRFYSDPRGSLPALVARGVDLWEKQFLYGEFSGILVEDSGTADVIVVWEDSVPPPAAPDPGPPVFACGGVTQVSLDSANSALSEPFHVSLAIITRATYSAGQVQACLQRTTVHELGHALGLFQHSPDSLNDIMASPPLVPVPSDGDRRTIQTLYHTVPTLAPPPR
jgi:predicted Zn-dependent protease